MAEEKDLIIIPSTDEEYECWKPMGNEKANNNIKYIEISKPPEGFNKIIVVEPCNGDPDTAKEKIHFLCQQGIINLEESDILFHARPDRSGIDDQILSEELHSKVYPYYLGIPLTQYDNELKEYIREIRKFLITLNPHLELLSEIWLIDKFGEDVARIVLEELEPHINDENFRIKLGEILNKLGKKKRYQHKEKFIKSLIALLRSKHHYLAVPVTMAYLGKKFLKEVLKELKK